MTKAKTQSNVTRLDIGRRIAEQGGVNGEPYEPLPPAKPVDPPPQPPPPPPEPDDLVEQIAAAVERRVWAALAIDDRLTDLKRRVDETAEQLASETRVRDLIRRTTGRRPALSLVKDDQ